jgi:hypothetical protein
MERTRLRLILAVSWLGMLAVAPSAWGSVPGGDAHLEVVHQSVSTPTQPVSQAAVRCPAGERAIGGGVLTDSGKSPMSLSASGPLDETGLTANTDAGDVPRYWYSAIANGYAGPQSYTHYAICSASSDATLAEDEVLLPAFVPSSGGGAGGTPGRFGESATCPSGTRAIGGGFGSSEEPSAYRRTTFDQPLAGDTILGATTGSVADGWYFFGENYGDAPVLMKVFAVCSASSRATVQAASFDADAPAQASAVCPGTGRATGGGFGATSDANSADWVSTAPATGAGGPASSDGDVSRGWFGRVDATAFSGTYRVYAVCEPGAPGQPTAGGSTPTSAPTGRRAAALKKCKKRHSKKARRRCRRKAKRLPV